MEHRQLKSFVTVARCGSFTRAAELLDYAQSSVTAQVQSLEAELGTRLFERLGRRVMLTGDGEKLIKYADQIIKLFSEAREVIGGSRVSGTLSIGAPESLCVYRLPDLLQKYRRLYPEVSIVIKSGGCPEMTGWLREGTIDVALFIHREIKIPDLIMKTLVAEPMAILVGAGHPLTGKAGISTGDLDGENLILCEAGCSYRLAIEAMLAADRAQPASVTEFGSVEAIKKTVISGLGITLLPRLTVEREVADGLLAELRWDGPEFNMVTQISYHKDKWISPALEAFIQMADEMGNN
ncbi:MAG: LysR family transcriptional regulator [Peptococcaceae bacterium BICA1-7]|nr:MAG: LysR family transcriptional regulator [Peptococcaceae bacterium BICA1-7]HBV97142.1 LysR family transcriptional regulator [Desulfotomaculum sp.]